MDYEGQRLAELIFYWIILTFGSVGWVIGYFQQDFTVVFQAWLVGVVLSVIVRSTCMHECQTIHHNKR
jgi:membrane protein CcdC involved in cytochrome C biogenesis